jgi:tetratricopeptide (TPR) repeat protein
MTNDPKAGGGLDPEMLAAYIDKRLPPDERAAVEAQLASDPDSYELLVELIHANEALKEQQPQDEDAKEAEERAEPQSRTGAVVPLVPKPARTRTWAIAGGVLAVAAALVLVVRLQPELWQRLRGGEAVDPQLAKLVAAVGDERSVEGRLAGGFQYAPLTDVTRGSAGPASRNLSLLAAAGEIQKAAELDPSAEHMHALGVALMLIGDYDGSIRSLRAAIEQAPGVATYQTDLAASLIARGRTLGQPEDLAPALAAADQALQLAAQSPEASFNRALALEALRLDEQAIAAYELFLTLEPTSGWATEARQRIRALRAKPQASAWSPGIPITRANVFRAREWLHDVALAQWASSVLEGRPDAAATGRIESIARQLDAVSGDHLGAAIADEVVAGSASQEPLLANGHAAFARARAAVRADRLADISREIRAACEAFRAARSRMTSVCEIEYAGVLFQERDFAGLKREVARLAPVLGREQFRAASARALWLQSLIAMLGSRMADAALPARLARQQFEAVGEWPSAARMWSLESDAEYWSGRYPHSWTLRARALEIAAQVQDLHTSYVVLSAAAGVLLNEQLPGPAAVFAHASIARSSETLPPLMQVYPLHRALSAAVEAGDLDLARRIDGQLRGIAATQSTDPRLRGMQTDISLATSTLQVAEGMLTEAEATLTQTIANVGPARDLSTGMWARLSRAEVYLLVGDTSRARDDLNGVVDRLTPRSGRAVTLRMADLGRLRRSVARLILDHQGNDPGSLALYERSRLVLLDNRYTSTNLSTSGWSPAPDTAILVYVDDGVRLGCWVIGSRAKAFYPLPATARELLGLTSSLAFLSQTSAAGSEVWRTSLRALDRILLEPLQSNLAGVSKLSIVTDGATKGVPFEALVGADGRPVAVRWTLSMSPSVSAAIGAASPPASPLRALVIGDPGGSGVVPLPGAKAEAEAVRAIYGNASRLLNGEAATRAAIDEALPAVDVIHFAGHAVSDSATPGRSYLQVASSSASPDGRWRVEDFRPGMFRGDQVVVIAACRGADATTDTQESVSSLAEAILRAGAGAVVASLWPISDSRARGLFEQLHRRLQDGMPVDAALQAAQSKFMRENDDPAAIAAWSGVMVFRAGTILEAP